MSILLLETIHEDAHALLEAHGPVLMADASEVYDKNLVEAIITRGRGRITPDVLDRHPALKAIARCGAGLDNIDLEAAHNRGIPVVHAPGKTFHAVAEHTFLLILSMARQICYLSDQVKHGNWGVRAGYSGLELRGKTLGIMGMGTTGQKVARLGSVFGMDIVYWNRSPLDLEYKALPFDEVLKTADFISLHTALTDETRHMIGADQLALMSAKAFLINTARGALIDENALLSTLNANQLAGYATDLLAEDPPPSNHPLLNHPLTLITPHSAVLTDTTYREICVFTAKNVLNLLTATAPDPGSIYTY